MKKSQAIRREINKLRKARDFTDSADYDAICYINEKIEKLLHEYETALNRECGIKE